MLNKIICATIILLLFVSCGTDKITREEGMANISGYVLAEYVNSGDNPNSPLYTVNTQRSARITLTKDIKEIQYSVETNKYSEFRLNVEPGNYNIMVETPHSFAKYYGAVEILNDTVMALKVTYDFFVIDSLVIDFYYGTMDNPPLIAFSEEYERAQLAALNEMIGYRLSLDGAVRFASDDLFTNYIYTSYRIPLAENVYTYDAFIRADMLLRSGMSEFPSQMQVGSQSYLRFIDFQNGGIDIVLNPDDFYIPDVPYINFYGDTNFYDPPDSI